MKRVTLVCKACGNEEQIGILTREDLEKAVPPDAAGEMLELW